MKKILIVDDEDGILNLIETILQRAGYKTVAAKDGKQALEMLVSHKPDLIFLDIFMPEMDGEETLIEIRKINKKIPVIICSASADIESAVRCIKHGALDYVTKPFVIDDILNAAKQALSGANIASAGKEAAEERKKGTKTVVASKDIAAFNDKKVAEKKQEEAGSKKSRILSERRKLLLPVVSLLFFGIIIIFFMIYTMGNNEKPHVYPIILYNNPTAITFDGKYLWVSDWYGQAIYKHEIDNKLSIKEYYPFSEIRPTGIAWGDNCLWTVDSWTAQINCHNLDNNLSIKKTYPYPGSNPAGIVFDGSFLWICDIENDMIYKLLPEEESLKSIAEYRSVGPEPVGIFWDGKNIWTVDSALKMVYKHNMDRRLTVSESYKFPAEIVTGMKISGVAWDGKHIWISEEKKSEIIRINIKQLKKIDS